MILSNLIVGLFLRLILMSFGTYDGDMNAWIDWSNRLVEVGFKDFYLAWSDYLPGYLYVLWFLGHVKNFFISINLEIPNYFLYKLPSVIADILTSFIIFKIIKRYKDKKIALFSSLIYLINPAILANSTLWGQADSFFTLFILFSFYLLLEGKIMFSALVFGLSAIIKPLSFFLLPLITVYFFLRKNPKSLITFLSISLTVILVSFLPFTNNNFLEFVLERFQTTLNQYTYTSLNAFNLWGVLSILWQNDSKKFLFASLQNWGMIIFSIFYLILLTNIIKKNIFKKTIKKQKRAFFLFFSASLVLFSSFMFLTRMHERHLLPVFPFLNIAAAFNPLIWPLYLLSSLIYVINLRYAYVWLSFNFKQIFSPFLISFFSGLQLLSLILLYTVFIKKSFKNIKQVFRKSRLFKIALMKGSNLNKKKQTKKKISFRKKEVVKVKNTKMYLMIILLFAFVLRAWNLWHPTSYIFDEVYHGFTAQEMAKGNIKAWEWWNTPPEGFAYEWTHPPLAKLIMAGGVLLFGKNNEVSQYAFRFPAVLFGLGVIYLIFLLAREIFRNEKIGLLAAFLASFDGLSFVMSRIGMADIYFLFFLLLSIYLTLKEKYIFSGISLGLAIATKWTGIYLYPVIGMLLIKKMNFNLKTIKLQLSLFFTNYFLKWLLAFIIAPIVIYLLSYTLFFTSGHTWIQFKELQQQMWWYHTNLEATHSYQSAAWTWPFMWRPVWFWVNYQDNLIGNIYNLGNPLLWWTGLFILPLAVYKTFTNFNKRKFSLGFVIFCYFSFWLPWTASPRIMFLHHYLPAIPFLSMLIAWFLVKIKEWKIGDDRLIIGYLLLIMITFMFFYPHYAGTMIPKELNNYLFWFSSWK
ncbi:glycosyltransferase family 39 protein [Patescibacteria group bacterium]